MIIKKLLILSNVLQFTWWVLLSCLGQKFFNTECWTQGLQSLQSGGCDKVNKMYKAFIYQKLNASNDLCKCLVIQSFHLFYVFCHSPDFCSVAA